MILLGSAGTFRPLCLVAACVLLAAFLLACGGDDADSATGDRLLLLEAETHALEESLETLHEENEAVLREVTALRDENTALLGELAALRQAQAQQEAYAAEESEYADAAVVDGLGEKLAVLEEVQVGAALTIGDLHSRMQDLAAAASRADQDLAALEEGQASTEQRLNTLDDRLQHLEESVSKADWNKPAVNSSQQDSNTLEKTSQLAGASGGEVYNIDSREPEERAILVMPVEPIDGNPLIVSLHSYGSNSADHSLYVPLHQQVVSRGFGLLLPNGTPDGEGNQSWNPTDQASDSGKASADDYAYLAGLVARALDLKDFGPVYIFGYSNGGFMAYYMACRGLPGLRAVASLAGTSYMDDAACEDAPPISVLHIHGGADDVILYGGSVAEPNPESADETASYASAQDMFHRWGERAGCNVQSIAYGLGVDLDDDIKGPETLTYAFPDGCVEGITVELWSSDEGGHTPGYGDAFVDALLDWFLSQK